MILLKKKKLYSSNLLLPALYRNRNLLFILTRRLDETGFGKDSAGFTGRRVLAETTLRSALRPSAPASCEALGRFSITLVGRIDAWDETTGIHRFLGLWDRFVVLGDTIA